MLPAIERIQNEIDDPAIHWNKITPELEEKNEQQNEKEICSSSAS